MMAQILSPFIAGGAYLIAPAFIRILNPRPGRLNFAKDA